MEPYWKNISIINKKLMALLAIYLSLVMLLALIGIYGDTSDETLKLALRYFNNDDIAAGRSYFLHGIIPSALSRMLTIILLAIVIVKGAYEKISLFLDKKVKYPSLRIIASFIFIFFILSLIKLPFNIYAGYYRDRIFDISVIDFQTWLVRYAGSAGISIMIISVTVGILALIVRNSRRYMIYIPGAFFVLSLSIAILYPRVITPLFYKTTKIADEALNYKVSALLKKAGLDTKNIFVINKSEYEISANAYLVGTGTERRIYLYDTLLKKFSHDEILSILSHEISHYIEEHMLIGIILGTVSMLLVIPLFNLFSKFLFGRDIKEMTSTGNHPSLILCLILMIFISNPVENAASRFMEKRADRYSLELTGRPDVFITMKVQLARVNMSNLLPHPVYSWFYGSHPTIIGRIKMAEDFGNK